MARPRKPLFDDSNPARYFKTDQPTAGVKVAGSGTKIRVLEERGHLGEDPHRHPGGHAVTGGSIRQAATSGGPEERSSGPPLRHVLGGLARASAQIQLGNHIRQRQCSYGMVSAT